jgi:hypothetical protein
MMRRVLHYLQDPRSKKIAAVMESTVRVRARKEEVVVEEEVLSLTSSCSK